MAATVDFGPLLASDPNHRGGRPFVAGTRLSVDRIAVMHGWDWSPERMSYEHSLDIWQVYAGLAFYLANKDTIDRDIDASDAEGERFAAAWRQGLRPRGTELDSFFPVASRAPTYATSLESLRQGVDAARVAALYADDLGPRRIAKDLRLDLPQVLAALAYVLVDRPLVAQLREEPADYDLPEGNGTNPAPDGA